MSFGASTPRDLVARVVADLQPRADTCGAHLLLVGAAARDLVLAAPAARVTNDVDIAIAVETREHLEAITHALDRVDGHTQRYVIDGVLVDIVPFGGALLGAFVMGMRQP